MGEPDRTKKAAAPELGPGVILGEKYRLGIQIGQGAMGTVWLATHVSLEQRVAIKVISQEHADSDELRKRFDTEARAAAKLRSRFVVAVYDHGETPGGLPYIVMEYLEGECLEDRIARLGAIPPDEALRVARHVARALGKAHAHGVIHRDLKPANIYIARVDDEHDDGDDWVAKVLDFGIAKVEDFSDRSTTKTGTVLGTPLFMSPEQVRGASDVDSRADLYSFGMVIYNMLTGTFAFEGQSFGDLLVSICTEPLPDITHFAPHLPAEMDAWFKTACARDAAERYQTADELVRGFATALGVADSGRMSSTAFSSVGLSISTLRQASEPSVLERDSTPSARHEQLAETYALDSESIKLNESTTRSKPGGLDAKLEAIDEPPRQSRKLVLGAGALAVVLGMGGWLLTRGPAEADSPSAQEAHAKPTGSAALDSSKTPNAAEASAKPAGKANSTPTAPDGAADQATPSAAGSKDAAGSKEAGGSRNIAQGKTALSGGPSGKAAAPTNAATPHTAAPKTVAGTKTAPAQGPTSPAPSPATAPNPVVTKPTSPKPTTGEPDLGF